MESRHNRRLDEGGATKDKYRVLLSDVIANSSVHGLPNIRRAKSVPKRVFWLVSFLTAVGTFIGLSSNLVEKYFDYGVAVGLQVDVERDLTFPAVTICNMNPLRKSLLNEDQLSHLRSIVAGAEGENEANKPVKTTDETPSNDTRRNSSDQHSGGYNYWSNIKEDFYETPARHWLMEKQVEDYLADVRSDERVEIGHQIEDLLINCQWNGFQCSPRNFTPFLNTVYGNCYTFNGNGKDNITTESVSSNFAGSTYGLTLELFVEQDEYLDSLIHSAGIRVTINPQDETPFPEDTGFNVEPGKMTSVGIVMGAMERLSEPFTDCVLANTSEHKTVFGGSYSVEACMKDCLLTYIAEKCNCTDGRYPKPDGLDKIRHCQYENSENRRCKSQADKLYQANKLTCDCPPKCSTVTYTKETSSSLWPSSNSEAYISEFLKGRSSKLQTLIEEEERTGQDLLRQNVGKLQIYFRDLTHQDVSQSQSYTRMDLVSDIGGNLGLWIGLSVLTIMEFVELIFDLFAILRFVQVPRAKRPEMTSGLEARVRRGSFPYATRRQGLTFRSGDVYYTNGKGYDRDTTRHNDEISYVRRNIYLPNS
ncbi:amiloride-sensitive sodium channel subunit alpha-like isoform X2 [Ptychodera flava]